MAMLNTVHDIPTCSSVDNDSRDSQLNRFWALESTPVLRTKLHTKDREFSCPENGGGYWNRPSMGNRVSDTMWDYPTDKVGEQGNCTNKLHLSDPANQLYKISCRRRDRDPCDQSAQSIQDVTPIALRTRNKIQRHKLCQGVISNETQHQSQFASETMEQILKLNKQSDEVPTNVILRSALRSR